MKELLQWAAFVGAGIALFVCGLNSALQERKNKTGAATPEYNPPQSAKRTV